MNFDELFEKLPQNVKFVVAFGETSEKIKKEPRFYAALFLYSG